MKFAATYTTCEQISPDDFNTVRVTKIFDISQSVQEVLEWVKSLGVRDPDINSVDFSALAEES